MIIGKGLIASQFLDEDRGNIIFFASGVSNSSERDINQFRREQDLIENIIENSGDKLFILVHAQYMILLNMIVHMFYTNFIWKKLLNNRQINILF